MKRTVAIIIAVCCLVVVGMGTVFAMDNWDTINILFRAGQIEREHLDSREALTARNDIFLGTNDFSIFESDISRMDEQFRLIGIEDGRERAIRFLLRREILYSEAGNRGFYASDREVRDLINLNIEAARSAENFESDFVPFLNGLGMTDVEYWESQADVFRKEIAISKFISSEFGSADAGSRMNDQEIIEERMQRYLQELVDNYVEANNLQWALNER